MSDNSKIIMTLDAGGTNFVFSAYRNGMEIVTPVHMPTSGDNLDKCLKNLAGGFRKVEAALPYKASAISFAFPGPADYENGIIGDLPNLPAFRSGIALGPYLEDIFGIPVFINNDGNLFAYGEALCGALPWANKMLEDNNVGRKYKNLIGITLGTGFGAGVVINGVLLDGDNGCGGDTWLMENSLHKGMVAEESVSIRAVTRVYGILSGNPGTRLSPLDIYRIAKEEAKGDMEAAVASFRQLGSAAGDAVTNALNIVDGLVVVGGGISGAGEFILPAMVETMNGRLGTFSGNSFPKLQMKAYNLEDSKDLGHFLEDREVQVQVPMSDRKVSYLKDKKTGVMLSRLGTERAVALGAYSFAINKLSGYDYGQQ